MTDLIRVLVFDDEKLVRDHLRHLLSTTSDIDWVGEIDSLQQLSQSCLERQPHVIVMGGRMKPFVFDIPAFIAQVSPATKIIALLNPQATVRAKALLATMLNGCLFYNEIDETLLHAIRAVAQGGTWFSRAVVRFMAHEPVDQTHTQPQAAWPHQRLTRRAS